MQLKHPNHTASVQVTLMASATGALPHTVNVDVPFPCSRETILTKARTVTGRPRRDFLNYTAAEESRAAYKALARLNLEKASSAPAANIP